MVVRITKSVPVPCEPALVPSRGPATRAPASLSSWQRPDFDAIEARYTVGLGPERDLASARDGPVGSGEQFFAVKRDREPWTLRPQAELVPLIRRNLGVGAFDLRSLAFDHMIETDVVLERIGA